MPNVLATAALSPNCYCDKTLAVAVAPPYYAQIDIMVPSATFAFLAARSNTQDFFEVFGDGAAGFDGYFVTAVHTDGTGGSFSSGVKNNWTDDSRSSPFCCFTPDVWQTVAFAYDGTAVSWSLDGTVFDSYVVDLGNVTGFRVGKMFGDTTSLSEAAYLDNFRVGTTPGGRSIFCDDFETGFSPDWDSTCGTISADPLGTGGPSLPCSLSYRLATAPGTVSIVQGATDDVTVSAILDAPPVDLTTLSATGVPAGVTLSFASNPVAENGGTSLVTVAVALTAAPGSYPIVIHGIDVDGRAATTGFTLTVIEFFPPPGGGFSVHERVPFN